VPELRTILHYPDPRLRQRSLPVRVFDDEIFALSEDLVLTLHQTGGIGLSAPQVGVLRRVMVMDLSPDQSAPEVYVNPELVRRSAFGLVEESCLSIPGITGNVVRATSVRIRAQDARGEPFERELEGMHAVCAQHEVDHLNGKLFIDRLNVFRRIAIALSARRGQVGE